MLTLSERQYLPVFLAIIQWFSDKLCGFVA